MFSGYRTIPWRAVPLLVLATGLMAPSISHASGMWARPPGYDAITWAGDATCSTAKPVAYNIRLWQGPGGGGTADTTKPSDPRPSAYTYTYGYEVQKYQLVAGKCKLVDSDRHDPATPSQNIFVQPDLTGARLVAPCKFGALNVTWSDPAGESQDLYLAEVGAWVVDWRDSKASGSLGSMTFNTATGYAGMGQSEGGQVYQ